MQQTQLTHCQISIHRKRYSENAIKTSSTRSQVAEEQTKANAINDAMHVLRQNIANNENVKNQSSYINAEPEKQNAYTDAVNAANAIINEQTQL